MRWHFVANGMLLPGALLRFHEQYMGPKKIYKMLFARYNLTGRVNIPIHITLSSSRAQTIVIKNSVEWCIESLLTDPRITDEDYLFFDNNPLSLPPEATDLDLEDINTGEAYRQTWTTFVTKPGKQVLFPIILYLDGATTGQFSDLPVTAFKMTSGIFNRKAREKPHFQRTMGYIPKVNDADKRKSRGKRQLFESGHVDSTMAHADMMEGEGNLAGSTIHKAQDYHDMLAIILEDLVRIQERGFLWDLKYRGHIYEVEFVPFVLFIKADTDKADVLCAKYKSRGRGVAQLCRYCYCPLKESNNPLAKYPPKNAEDIQKLVDSNDLEALKAMSQQPIKNACYKLRFPADNAQGIHGCSPIEILHAVLLGVFQYVRDVFFEKLGKNSNHTLEFEALANEYGTLFKRQSARDMPKTSFSNGISSGKKQAKEFIGIFLVLAAVMCSTKGRNILKNVPFFRKNNKMEDWAYLVELMLMWEKWLKSNTIPKDQVRSAKRKFQYLMYLIRKTAPREKGMKWKIMKFHAISHMADDILRFGVPKNFDTEADEAGHKPSKAAAKLTQKRKKEFDKQVGERLNESHVLQLAHEEMHNHQRIVDYFTHFTEQQSNVSVNKKTSILGCAHYGVRTDKEN